MSRGRFDRRCVVRLVRAPPSRRSPRPVLTRFILGLAGLGLIACGGPPEPPPAAPAPSAPEVTTAPLQAPEVGTTHDRALCEVLAGLLEAEPQGFSTVRGAPVAPEQWIGSEVPPGTQVCRVEGRAWPRARYVCSSAPFGEPDRDSATARFDALAGEIDQCLAKPIWFPRSWQKGRRHEFAMGEQLQTWTDRSTAPPSAVTLKVEQDLVSDDYRLRLSLETIR